MQSPISLPEKLSETLPDDANSTEEPAE